MEEKHLCYGLGLLWVPEMGYRGPKLPWATEKEALVFLPSDFLARSQCYQGYYPILVPKDVVNQGIKHKSIGTKYLFSYYVYIKGL